LSFKSSNTHCNIATLYTCTHGGDTQAEAEVGMGIGKKEVSIFISSKSSQVILF